jgi:RecG-like helicase
MIPAMTVIDSISLDTRILDLPGKGIPRFGSHSARKLALAVTEVSRGKDIDSADVEDLLAYLPARYEDRSSMVEIRHLYHGLEASLDLTVRLAGGFQVRNRRSFKQRLYMFEISASDHQHSGRPVMVWWFVSGARAQQIIQ